ncbi:TRAP transporter small permease [Thalassospira alkalitolerans]|uniref:TRAP transporter small permease protein n=1 Tax=Thalassospira alkalitolerans TaxID=1293890 RepID=A0A1Y2LEA9_9PROT|nr:TRAP transporter small permease [Thalassospira alkalitolerans]OSQ48852.1 C4-dicarboxylate ABC transporter permease [Thalassospira alkalitolerans]|tara:strand:- start:10532 stop:11053 length:522 start_codon:yes stop_codon:yes gene_type:complete
MALRRVETIAAMISRSLNWVVERVIAVLMLALVLDVWLGVVDRYIFHWQMNWPEELARYLMIWAALLAISAGIARREHIGIGMFVLSLPMPIQRTILFCVDLIALGAFLYLAIYGFDFAAGGMRRQAMIFGMSLMLPYAAVPVASLLAAVQLLLVALRDQGRFVPVELAEGAE